MAEIYLDIIKWGEQAAGVKMLTPEFEIVCILLDADRIAPIDMLPHFSGSTASFFKTLKSLEAKDVVRSEVNPSDRRSKFYQLSHRARTALGSQWQQRSVDEAGALNRTSESIKRFTDEITRSLRIKLFTCEYQMLLHLNSSPGMPNIDYQELVDVSESKFNICLPGMVESDLLHFEIDCKDRRKRLYFINSNIASVFSEMDKRLDQWMKLKLDSFSATHQDNDKI